MSMGTSEAVLQVFSGTVPRTCCSDSFVHKLDSAYPLNSHIRCVKKLVTRNRQFLSYSSMLQKQMGIYRFQGVDCGGLQHLICKCHRAESVNETTADDENGTWFVDSAKKLMPTNRVMDAPTVLEFEDVQECKPGNKGFASNGTAGTSKNPFSKVNIDSLEEEAWDLLRESMVYYCGSPIGTIAAKDPTSSNVLNYDHVFIRDFIPSGIAFLLKGEYVIVRNFILHTLQLQSWEKTMDCHSPGQGLMPASFKVRTVPLDGDEFATKEVLDPDFGEAVIGRVAPIDSGLWWIILLRAYGKCFGDLSVQERVDVQTGIKMRYVMRCAGLNLEYYL